MTLCDEGHLLTFHTLTRRQVQMSGWHIEDRSFIF